MIDYLGLSDYLNFSIDSAVKGTALIQWDGPDQSITLVPNGLGTVDFTSGNTNDVILARLLTNDVPASITLRAYCGSASNYLTFTTPTPGGIQTGSSVDVSVPFSSFTVVGTCPSGFAQIGAFEMFIDGTLAEATDLVVDFIIASGDRDYGDLPDGYPVELAGPGPGSENGTRHIASGVLLGTNRDTEADGTHSPANADDITGAPDDEDGVSAVGQWTSSNGGTVRVTVTGCQGDCYLSGWVDFNDNTSFADSGDQIFNGSTDQQWRESGLAHHRPRLRSSNWLQVCTFPNLLRRGDLQYGDW